MVEVPWQGDTMTIADLIDNTRLELGDEQKTRWSDGQLLRVVGKAYRRLSHVLYRNDIELGRSLYRFSTEPGRDDYPLPADFMADYGLYREDTNAKLVKQSDDSWQQQGSPAECSTWLIRGETLLVGGAPTATIPLTLLYWPLLDTASLDLDAPTPFGGKLDDLVSEYAALRLKNIDEMDIGADTQLLEDLENNLLNTYSAISPVTVQRRGWLV